MAAHGLTIARQLLAIKDDAELLRQATLALNAPGFDVGCSDPTLPYDYSEFESKVGDVAAHQAERLNRKRGYEAIYSACCGDAYACGSSVEFRVAMIRRACRDIARKLSFLDGYASLEDAARTYNAFVRVGKPQWQRRAALWFAGDDKAHTRRRDPSHEYRWIGAISGLAPEVYGLCKRCKLDRVSEYGRNYCSITCQDMASVSE